MQKDRTLQFWDDYHKRNDDKEWISTPGEELLAMICRRGRLFETADCLKNQDGAILHPERSFRILEIGCGTSTLVRDLKAYMERHLHDSSTRIFACGTDVSPVCIDHCRQRDHDLIAESHGSLHYEVLNILEADDGTLDGVGGTRHEPFDVILDKGCVDTFLFRSRLRGESGVYPDCLRRAFDNLHSWMGTSSCYMVISPRSKLKALRDYAGFESVQRHPLPPESSCAAEIVKGGGRNDDSDGDSNDDNHKSSYSQGPQGYLYVCHKSETYTAGKTSPFRTNHRDLPGDDNQCNRCHTAFYDFRRGEAVEGRGLVFWAREFRNHCIHCKG
jgi:SAM-dependent methyltransferase